MSKGLEGEQGYGLRLHLAGSDLYRLETSGAHVEMPADSSNDHRSQ